MSEALDAKRFDTRYCRYPISRISTSSIALNSIHELNIQPYLLHATPMADPEPDTSPGMPIVTYT